MTALRRALVLLLSASLLWTTNMSAAHAQGYGPAPERPVPEPIDPVPGTDTLTPPKPSTSAAPAVPSPNAPIKLVVPVVGEDRAAIAVQLVGVPTEVSCPTLATGGFLTRERLAQLTDIGNPKGAGQAYSEKTRRQAA